METTMFQGSSVTVQDSQVTMTTTQIIEPGRGAYFVPARLNSVLRLIMTLSARLATFLLLSCRPRRRQGAI